MSTISAHQELYDTIVNKSNEGKLDWQQNSASTLACALPPDRVILLQQKFEKDSFLYSLSIHKGTYEEIRVNFDKKESEKVGLFFYRLVGNIRNREVSSVLNDLNKL